MKRIVQFWMLAVIVLLVAPASFAVVSTQQMTMPMLDESHFELAGGQQNLTIEEFLSLTPKAIQERTGKKLTLKEAAALKLAQKKIKKDLKHSNSAPKSQLVALLLVIFVGVLGIHRFYLGYTTIGIIQLLTLGGCGIWALIDLIRIITGDLKPADGSEYDPKL